MTTTSTRAAKKPAKKAKKKTAKKVQAKRGKEKILSVSNGNSNAIKVEFYLDKKGEARWRLVRRGRIIGASTEGYKRVASAKSNFKGLREAMGLVDL